MTTLKLPKRLETPSSISFVLGIVAFALVYTAFTQIGFNFGTILDGAPRIGRLIDQMFPPNLTRIEMLSKLLWETFLMALCGTVIGIIVSIPMAILAARNLSPHPAIRFVMRNTISFFRTVPDLIWALVFVITVGLGPIAGAMTIAIDTIGFLGKFFAESMEEQDKGPQEAIRTMGGNTLDVTFAAVIPNAMPSFINDSIFALEKATRSSVILGLVGAGGIGIELKVAMDMFNYSTATTIILMIFVLVLSVEQLSNFLRRKIIK
ncbi:phosphonate ABC transporter, permease protein PhnE [Photobacterium makurazakiensis]|uniref:phosphonate ABC transporter, permease protein PhnE n=1 Tax=Photobacterium makurazakiensis TaxID=2910234 RepID=UPI003D10CE90